MKISEFFIDRPIFAAVVSTFITIAGALALIKLPVGEYPEVVPPSIVVTANYPGANPKVIADTVAAPLEQAIVGVDDMLYMSSTSTMNGTLSLTVTFKLGADVDRAQVQVQNRVAQAQPRLPQEVRDLGVTTVKSSSDLTMLVNLISPNGRYDALYLRNYAALNIRDVLARLPGMGQVQVFGGGDYAMRVWLDPEKLAVRDLTANDVVTAIREQNVDVAAGQLGAPPSKGTQFQIALNAAGRLTTDEQFRNIIVKTGANGELVRLGDLARIEMGAQDYGMRSMLDNQNAIALPIMQAPGANALQLSSDVRRTMEQLKKDFPDGVDYRIAYDPTQFVRQSIEAVLHTLLEAILLVVIVVIIFLQTWRASLIPLVAVPVSIIGTFAVLLGFGFSINTLSLFGLVLAIGIVVDDAIVVVENVERHIAKGESPKEAARMAMREVSRPIIAITLVLVAVFGPVAFISGLTGEFYRQFALTIAISTVISAFNSLTLSPALAAVLLKPHGARPDLFARWMEQILGRFFRRFNKAFAAAGDGYSRALKLTIRRSGIALAIYGGLIVLAWVGFNAVPGGFIPSQDKQYLIAVAQLPPASTIDRTEAVVRRMSEIGLKTPGVEHAVEFAGMSVNGWSQSSSSGIAFFALEPPSKRKGANLSGTAIAARLNGELASIQDAYVVVFTPPPVLGLGSLGGFKAQVEDRGDAGPEALYAAVQDALGKAAKSPQLAGLLSTYQINVPQLDVTVDRDKVKQQGVKLSDVFDTLQTYMGSTYVNDFNRFGRTFQVLAQADGPFRAQAEDIRTLKTRNAAGAMVPLGSLLNVTPTFGPDAAQRYNAYRSADINAGPAPGYSTDQAQEALAGILKQNLPRGMTFEWTDLAYQQLISGNTATIVFPLCVLFVFLVLAAQYESLTLPLAIILIVPMCLLAGITGVYLDHGDNNVFTQIGLLVLVGLACKNAILIIEFAKHLQEDRGMDARSAVLEAAHLRLRPILMTSFAFIMGVVPLVLAQGSGAEVRHAMGVTVFAGMIGVTCFGLLLTPVFFVLLRRLTGSRVSDEDAPQTQVPAMIGQQPEVHGA
ncbi:MAG TPA: multidrug efflux RND transporter permease subunit [Steroidobacteraceae bacterium]|jgi:hydrophobe/amphiphile efflux-1 (HAE1) family protein|nr:multidrug efflux RND transporter permease subunit [Steroidobacteraceae bacterium]